MAQVKVLFLKVIPPFSPLSNSTIFSSYWDKIQLNTFCIFNHHKWQAILIFRALLVIPPSLNLFTCDTHFPWPPRSGVQMEACVLLFFDHSDGSSKWRSRLVFCRWLTWSFSCASHGRVVIASLSSHPVLGELFRRQPLIIYPGFPPTWLCLVEQ